MTASSRVQNSASFNAVIKMLKKHLNPIKQEDWGAFLQAQCAALLLNVSTPFLQFHHWWKDEDWQWKCIQRVFRAVQISVWWRGNQGAFNQATNAGLWSLSSPTVQTLGMDSEKMGVTLLNGSVVGGTTCEGYTACFAFVVVLVGGFPCVRSAFLDVAKSTMLSAIGFFFSPSWGGVQRFAVLTERRMKIFLHLLQKIKPKPSSFLGEKGMNRASFWW